MSSGTERPPADLELPQRLAWNKAHSIAAPSHEAFTSRFGIAFPEPHYLESDLGSTAVYSLPAPSGQSKRHVLVVHGLNTPGLGMLTLARELQSLDPNAHVVLYDLWGHGLSSTPLTTHAPHIFHTQILQVLSFMQWTRADIIGYSFGGATAIRFSLFHPWAVSSVSILAPAGILNKSGFEPKMQDLLTDSTGREAEAADCVMSWLEGGPLVVPQDWRERSRAGKVVAEAFREWEVQEHKGFSRSVLSMFRDGGVYGGEEYFRRFAKLPLRKVTVLGELDDVCTKQQLLGLGFEDVEVIEKVGHACVRSHPADVAHIIHGFWNRSEEALGDVKSLKISG